MKRKVVVLTGAGMSAESGLSTFRDAGGLWEGHDVMQVASPEGWASDMDLVLEFYNQRRRQLLSARPNEGHLALTRLEDKFDVAIVTQNVDDLHERAGSQQVIHLHGELLKARSTRYPELVYAWTKDLLRGDLCERGGQLRPHIVWFGEAVPMMDQAIEHISEAVIVIVIGTSMQVYPAAGLIYYAPMDAKIYYIDPRPQINTELALRLQLNVMRIKAGEGIPRLVDDLLQHHIV
ncbi:MAG TPA: NAD-dependent deacylase [Saprospiraceae bacterium]|nr:NAD-dependent deacylase [Saprospiraceae bacterium]